MKGIKEFIMDGGFPKIVVQGAPWVAAAIVGAQFYAVRELFIVWTIFALAYCILAVSLFLCLVISEPIRMALRWLTTDTPLVRIGLHHSVDRASTARIQE